ncbi:FAD-binding oxidoreductase [bacterium]|nr:FAD-binding oxidoreductase [bacterium]
MPDSGALTDEFKRIVGTENLLLNKDELSYYTVDGICSEVVVFPSEESQVKRILESAYRHDATVIPRGHGSKMGLGGIPTRADVILSLERLNSVIELLPDDLTVTVQAGITLSELQRQLLPKNLTLPIDPPGGRKTSPVLATLGGIVATNSNGPGRLKYNSLRDLVIGIKVILADGTIIKAGGKTVKNVSGYDMKKLFIGSLGTLGVIVEITARLAPLSETGQTILASFAELPQATKVVANILKSELLPKSIELFSPVGADLLGMPSEHFLLVIDIEDVKESVSRQSGQIKQICESEKSSNVNAIQGQERDALLGIMQDWPMIDAESDTQVCCKISLPIGRVAEAFQAIENTAEQGNLDTAIMSHAGSGIIYVILTPQTDQAQFEATIENLALMAQQFGGISIVEHAPAEIKGNIDVWGATRSDIALMRQIKEQLDSKNLLNPGRFVGGI